MKKSLFVISDLHLGGKPGFQMCSPAGRKRLAEFVLYVASQQHTSGNVQLVINGDIVDFLAEEEFEPFTSSNDTAAQKLHNIVNHTIEVWESFKELLKAGARLTLLLGNHDIELSLPGPRQLLQDVLGAGNVEFIYDNQAYREGPILIEHGNRYDWWNVVHHDGLREFRSATSRGETPPPFSCPAGSRLVAHAMNKIKEDFPFVDLLKPEDGALLPILAVMNPSAVSEIENPTDLAFDLAAKWLVTSYDKEGKPTDKANIAAATDMYNRDHDMAQLAAELAYGAGANVGVRETFNTFWELWGIARSQEEKGKQLTKLYKALRKRADTTWKAFNVNEEDEVYIRPAQAAARERGFTVIVFGHTHLVKRVSLKSPNALYLNSGTWADLMRVPESVLTGKAEEAAEDLAEFVEDLRSSKQDPRRLDSWRTQVPTFARIDLENTSVVSANVFRFDGTDAVVPVADGRLDILARTKETALG